MENPTESVPPGIIGRDLGVIVDRSIFDDDELTIPMDLPCVIDEEGSFSGSLGDSETQGARVMKNGRVRRRLRWTGFRRNKRGNVSSNQSVMSALTARSAASNRSVSTARSFLSHFSRKSHNSFHTFHSTATPVVKNSRQSQHTFERPNYKDTFQGSSYSDTYEFEISETSTVSNEGHQSNLRTGNRQIGTGYNEPQENPIPEQEFLDLQFESEMPVIAISSNGPAAFLASPQQPALMHLRSRRSPLFHRMSHRSRALEPSAKSNAPFPSLDTLSTSTTSSSSLSRPLSWERQESQLLVLESEDCEGDRRVALWEHYLPERPARWHPATCETIEETDIVGGNAVSSNQLLTETSSIATTSVSSSSTSSASQGRTTPSRRCGRPVDSTDSPAIDESDNATTDGKAKRASVAVDWNGAAFLEAEHNLRAIHEMATEHLVHGEYEEAVEVFEEILRGQEARYGVNSYRVGTALHNLGLVYIKSGNFAKAIEVSRRAVLVRKEALIPNHPDVALSLTQLGVARLENRDFEEAVVSFQEALSIRRNHLGDNHMKNAKLLNNIGCAQYAAQNYDDALEAFEKALDIQRMALGSADVAGDMKGGSGSDSTLLSMASTLCNTGSIMSKQGRFEEAEHALEEALLVRHQMLASGISPLDRCSHRPLSKCRSNNQCCPRATRRFWRLWIL